MQKKILKIMLIIIVFIISSIGVFPIKSFADNTSWAGGAQNFLNAGSSQTQIRETDLRDASSSIYNMLTSVGMIISVVVGMILGIKYMMSSIDEKANVKESLMPYVVGCIVTFGAFGIWKIMIRVFWGI